MAGDLTAAAERAYELLGPLTARDEENGSPLRALVAALAQGEQPVWALAENPGLATHLAPASAPAEWLPWLARIVGARLTGGMSVDRQRAEIALPSARARGSVEKLADEIRPLLTGQQRVLLRIRSQSAWRIVVVTYSAETPDEAAVREVIDRYDIAGVRIVLLVVDGWTISELVEAYAGKTIADLVGDFASIADFNAKEPI